MKNRLIDLVRLLLIGQLLLAALGAPNAAAAALNRPMAALSADKLGGLAPLTVQFRDDSTGQPDSWLWNFGDGAFSTEEHPSHQYSKPGVYTVSLRVANAAGEDSVQHRNLIVVNSAPVIEPPDPHAPAVAEAEGTATSNGQNSAQFGYNMQAAGAPNIPLLQNPPDGATGVSTPGATLESCVSDPDGDDLTVTFYGRDLSTLTVPDFTIVAIPDTQFYYGDKGAKATFQAQMDWVVNNKASRNIVFVSHLGDVVQDGSNPNNDGGDADGSSSEQWAHADQVMSTIENPSTTQLVDGIPYGISVGNHDQGPSFGDPSKTTLFNQYFGVSRFNGRQYYGGHLGADNDNSYQLFSVGDLDFMAIHLEFDESRPTSSLDWVDSLLQSYPERWAVLTSHELVHPGSGGYLRPQGEKIWNAVKDNPNIFLMLSGHHSGEANIELAGYHGNRVNALVSDYQARSRGGDGWMRYMEFSGSSSTMTTFTYSPTRQEYETDANSQFNVAWDTPATAPMRRPFQLIGQKQGVHSGTCTSTTWSGLQGNRDYEWYVGVTDSDGNLSVAQRFSERATFSTAQVNALSFSTSSYQIDEDAGAATVTVNLNRVNSSTVTVQYATANDTASASSDYVSASGTLTFGPGQTSQSFLVNVRDDALFEGDEQIRLSLSNPTNAGLSSPSAATVTIVEDDSPPLIQIEQAAYEVNEEADAVVDLVLSAAAALPVSVHYATSNGSAKSSQDYTATSGVVTIDAGATRKALVIPIVDDTDDEAAETFSVTLSAPDNAQLGSRSSTTVTIVDNDSATVQFQNPTLSVAEEGGSALIAVGLNKAAADVVTVHYAVTAGSAQSGTDFVVEGGTLTFAPGETGKTVPVAISDDSVDEQDETFQLHLSGPVNALLGTKAAATVTIIDNDSAFVEFDASNFSVGEGDGAASILVHLTTPSDRTVTVNYVTGGDTAEAGRDYTAASGQLLFAPGETRKSYPLSVLDDQLDEDNEQLLLMLQEPHNAALGSISTATLTIVDNEQSILYFAQPQYSVGEDEGKLAAQVVLSPASVYTVSVDYVSQGVAALDGSDYTAPHSGTLTFAPGEKAASFQVPLLNDNLAEPDETFVLSLQNAVHAALSAPVSATVTIVDDDIARIGLTSDSYSVTETGDILMDVVLSAVASQVLTVDYATFDLSASAGSDYVASSGRLTFAPGDVSKQVAIALMDDQLSEADERFGFFLTNPQGGVLGSPASAQITIADDDVVGIHLASAAQSISESAGLAEFEVVLNNAASRLISVEYATSDGSAKAGVDYASSRGLLTFQPGETRKTVGSLLFNNRVANGERTFTFTLGNPTGATLVSPSQAVVHIIDDDQEEEGGGTGNLPTVQFSRATYGASEADGSARISVTLSSPTKQKVTVDYTALGNEAAVGSDYDVVSGTLLFPPGTTAASFDVSLLNDAIHEPTETLQLQLQNVVNGLLNGHSAALLTIADDDAEPLLSLGNAHYQPPQAGENALLRFAVLLNSASASEIRVDYSVEGATQSVKGGTINGWKADGQNVANSTSVQGPELNVQLPVTGTVVFAPGETQKLVSLFFSPTELGEMSAPFVAKLNNAVNAQIDAANGALQIATGGLRKSFLPLTFR